MTQRSFTNVKHVRSATCAQLAEISMGYLHISKSKSLQKKTPLSTVTFRVLKGSLTPSQLKERHLHITPVEKLIDRGICSSVDDWELKGYDYLTFDKGIKGGESNISGALQRIKKATIGIKGRYASNYWINSKQHVDKNHPDEFDDFEYSPFIDGFEI